MGWSFRVVPPGCGNLSWRHVDSWDTWTPFDAVGVGRVEVGCWVEWADSCTVEGDIVSTPVEVVLSAPVPLSCGDPTTAHLEFATERYTNLTTGITTVATHEVYC